MGKRMIATGGYRHGVYFTRTAGLTVVRTARETTHTIEARRAGALCVAWVGGGMESVAADGDGDLARWAVRLAVELCGEVELRVGWRGPGWGHGATKERGRE